MVQACHLTLTLRMLQQERASAQAEARSLRQKVRRANEHPACLPIEAQLVGGRLPAAE